MSIFKRNGKGNYYIQFNYRGKTYIKSSKTTNKRTAEKLEREWRQQVHALFELGERERITLRDALTGYEESRLKTGSERYAIHGAKLLNEKFPTDLFLDEIQPWHLNHFKTQREKEGCAAQTIKHNFQVIRSSYQWAKDNGFMVKDLEFPKLKVDNKRLRFLTMEEEKRLLAELEPQNTQATGLPLIPKFSSTTPKMPQANLFLKF